MNLIKNLTLCSIVGLGLISSGCTESQDKIPKESFSKIELLSGEVILGKTEESLKFPGDTNINTDESFLGYDPVEKSRISGRIINIFVYDNVVKPAKAPAEDLYNIMSTKPDTASVVTLFKPIDNPETRWAYVTIDINSDSKADWLLQLKKDVDREIRIIREGDNVTFPTLRKYEPREGYATPDKYRVINFGGEVYPGEIKVQTK